MDLAHNGVVRQNERITDGVLSNRISNIKLWEATTLDGKNVWFPVGGKIQWFAEGRTVYLEGTFDVVHGSIKINQNLSDLRFTLDYGLDARNVELAREYNTGKRRSKDTGPLTSAKALSQTIYQADDPSKRLVAHPNSTGWLGFSGGAILVIIGVLILATTAFMKKRAS